MPISTGQWIEWHSTATVLLAGTAVGDVWMWLIPNGDCKVMPGQGVASTCGACLSDGKLQYRTNLLEQNSIVAVDQYLYLHHTVPLTVQTQCSVHETNLCHFLDYVDIQEHMPVWRVWNQLNFVSQAKDYYVAMQMVQ